VKRKTGGHLTRAMLDTRKGEKFFAPLQLIKALILKNLSRFFGRTQPPSGMTFPHSFIEKLTINYLISNKNEDNNRFRNSGVINAGRFRTAG
jgi:hypothetical protein